MRYDLYFEVFDKFTAAVDKKEKIKILQTFAMSRGGSRLPEFLDYAFNPNIKFDISGIPAYKPSILPAGLNDSYLHQELAKLYIFIDGHRRRATKLTLKKEQSILIHILSALHKDEAMILEHLLRKKVTLHVKGLTAKIAKEAFPTLSLKNNLF